MPSQRYHGQTILLYIDEYDNDIPVGRFHCPALGESGGFRSMTQLLMRIDQCLDIQNAPQAFCHVRSFSPGAGPWSDPEDPAGVRPGSVATFTLQLHFRRNASWQGTLTWQETRDVIPFRSALELIYLINSAASGTRQLLAN